jgi:hypothetical protein
MGLLSGNGGLWEGLLLGPLHAPQPHLSGSLDPFQFLRPCAGGIFRMDRGQFPMFSNRHSESQRRSPGSCRMSCTEPDKEDTSPLMAPLR